MLLCSRLGRSFAEEKCPRCDDKDCTGKAVYVTLTQTLAFVVRPCLAGTVLEY
jgi:hypothetical protein